MWFTIASLSQVDAVFVFCMDKNKYQNLLNEYKKLVDIFIDLDSLCFAIQKYVRIVNKQSEISHFLIWDEKSIKDLFEESIDFR